MKTLAGKRSVGSWMSIACMLFLSGTGIAQWSSDPNVNNQLTTPNGNHKLPQSVSDGAGGAIITWENSQNIHAQRISASGVLQWTANGIAICTATSAQTAPKIVSDGAGGAIITWYDARTVSSGYDIYAQRVNAAGVVQWTTDGVALCTLATDQHSPTIANDGAGGAIIVWQDNVFGPDIYAQHISSAGAVQWATNGVAICTAAGSSLEPTITGDGAGGAIIAWYDSRVSSSDIYAQRISSTGVPQWTANGVAICTALNSQQSPIVISDNAGGAIITWNDLRNITADIYAQRVNATGSAQWTANGVAICTAVDGQFDPTLVADGAGGALITWYDNRSGTDYDIYAQRVNSVGAMQWIANGVAACVAANHQVSSRISDDGAGGAIVVWHDLRNSSDYSIYAQHITPGGFADWTANGVPICTAVNNQLSPAICSNGSGGAIIAWEDYRANGITSLIYTSRVNSDGALPVQLASFTGTRQGNSSVRLDWRTISEINNYGFYIQRRSVGVVEWWSVENSFVAGHGTTNEPHDYRFTDYTAPQGNLEYRLRQVDLDGSEHFTEAISVSSPTGVKEIAPKEFSVKQNYPNPFNPTTTIQFSVEQTGRATLEVCSLLGQKVATLFDDVALSGQYYKVRFDGSGLSSGMYFYRLKSGEKTELKRLVLIK